MTGPIPDSRLQSYGVRCTHVNADGSFGVALDPLPPRPGNWMPPPYIVVRDDDERLKEDEEVLKRLGDE